MKDFACLTCGSLRFIIEDMVNGELKIRCIFCNFEVRVKIIDNSIKWNVTEFLKSLDKDKLQELLKAVAIIVDPLSQELIRKGVEEDDKKV